MVLAGANLPFPRGDFLAAAPEPPILWFQGDADHSVTGDFRLAKLYAKASQPRFELQLQGATHTSAVEGHTATEQIDLVAGATVDFLDRYLANDLGALWALHEPNVDRRNRHLPQQSVDEEGSSRRCPDASPLELGRNDQRPSFSPGCEVEGRIAGSLGLRGGDRLVGHREVTLEQAGAAVS